MKLDRLLKQITPLPIKACVRGDYSDDGIVLLGDRRVAVVFDEKHAAYLVHAANSFPKLVAAGQALIDAELDDPEFSTKEQRDAYRQAHGDFIHAVFDAHEVKPAPTNVNHPVAVAVAQIDATEHDLQTARGALLYAEDALQWYSEGGTKAVARDALAHVTAALKKIKRKPDPTVKRSPPEAGSQNHHA